MRIDVPLKDGEIVIMPNQLFIIEGVSVSNHGDHPVGVVIRPLRIVKCCDGDGVVRPFPGSDRWILCSECEK